VVVVPDGPLFLLPLEALVVEEGPDLRASRFWLDAGPVLRYAPSATFLHQLRSRPSPAPTAAGPPTALSVSDPSFGPQGREPAPAPSSRVSPARGAYLGGGGRLARLPGTATESRAVREALEGVADVVVLAGTAAREPAVRKELPGKRFLHIATHGLVDEEQGELFAALALAPPPSGAPAGDDDGFLQLFEIYELRLDCELAVLSACSSNTGRVVAGEGVFALSRGFLVGGARRVVASQWPVDDESTAALVGALFRRVASAERSGGRLDAARALRDAKLEVRRGRAEWAHPFFWAPFVITGLD
jgi:CHAT domain-containing protein